MAARGGAGLSQPQPAQPIEGSVAARQAATTASVVDALCILGSPSGGEGAAAKQPMFQAGPGVPEVCRCGAISRARGGAVSAQRPPVAQATRDVCQWWHSARRTPSSCLTTDRVPDSTLDAGWSSLAAREAHNLEVGGSNPPPAMMTLAQASGRGR